MMYMHLDFEVTFETDHYIIDKNQVSASIKLLLRYPVYYGELVMFPVNVTIDEENGNATGKFYFFFVFSV